MVPDCASAGQAAGPSSLDNACDVESCEDGAKNQDETDVDCGGSCEAKCALGRGCSSAGDCVSVPHAQAVICEDKTCVVCHTRCFV